MSLEINDIRSIGKGVLWADLQVGVVYVDKYDNYLMAIDLGAEYNVVDLSDGLVSDEDSYHAGDLFTPTKCKLEVFA